MAEELIRLGRAEETLKLLEVAMSGPTSDLRCVFYEPHGEPSLGKGRCTMYQARPLVCRLFGFAATRAKVRNTAERAPWMQCACPWDVKASAVLFLGEGNSS